MKIMQISLLLLILAVAMVSGCKVTKDISVQEPSNLPIEGANPSEQAVDSGLQELEEIDSLADETDLGLDELENLQLE